MSDGRGAPSTQPSHRRRPLLRAVVGAVLAAGIFMLGVALGQATKTNPTPGPPETQVRTIVPVPATVTTTVTTTVSGQP